MKRVLVVDDSPTCRAWICSELRKRGFVCVECGTVRDAMATLARETFDLIVVDYELPSVTGAQLVKDLRAARSTMPIVMVSSHELGAYPSKIGCDGFVMKGDGVTLRNVVSRIA